MKPKFIRYETSDGVSLVNVDQIVSALYNPSKSSIAPELILNLRDESKLTLYGKNVAQIWSTLSKLIDAVEVK